MTKKTKLGKIIDKTIKKGVESGTRTIERVGKKKAKAKRLLKKGKIVVRIRPVKEAPYVSRYFKNEWEEAKDSLYFK